MEGALEIDDLSGGPSGGKGMDESETELGVMSDEQYEPWLDASEGGLLEAGTLCFSAA